MAVWAVPQPDGAKIAASWIIRRFGKADGCCARGSSIVGSGGAMAARGDRIWCQCVILSLLRGG